MSLSILFLSLNANYQEQGKAHGVSLVTHVAKKSIFKNITYAIFFLLRDIRLALLTRVFGNSLQIIQKKMLKVHPVTLTGMKQEKQ